MNTDENKKDPKKEWLDHNINLQADMLAKSSRIPYVTTNMNTDEIVEEFKQTNIYKTARVSGYGKKMEDWLRTTLANLRQSEAQKREDAMTPNTSDEENWKVEFENEFAGWWDYKTALTERIEDYIQSLLQSEAQKREEAVREERERIIKDLPSHICEGLSDQAIYGWNLCRNKTLQALTEKHLPDRPLNFERD